MGRRRPPEVKFPARTFGACVRLSKRRPISSREPPLLLSSGWGNPLDKRIAASGNEIERRQAFVDDEIQGGLPSSIKRKYKTNTFCVYITLSPPLSLSKSRNIFFVDLQNPNVKHFVDFFAC